MVTNETSNNQKRLEERIIKECGQDRHVLDQFYTQVLAQLDKSQTHRRETEHYLTDVQENSHASIDSILETEQTNEHRRSIAKVQGSLAVPEYNPERSDFVFNSVGHWSSIDIRADLRNISECGSGCKCSCHIRRRISTPRLLDGFLGTLFIGYSGSPLLVQRCDQITCRGRKDSSTNFVYKFPWWFVMSRIVQLKAKVTAMYGPEVSLRFNRVVDGKALVFHYATTGDVHKMKSLFEQGRASPSDIRFDSGWTPLHVSVLLGVNLFQMKCSC